VFSDQQSSDMLGCYGNDQIITPNIDKMAAEGVRFNHCISSSPVCTPYRGMLMSGQHPLHGGAMVNDVQMLPGNGNHFGEVLREGIILGNGRYFSPRGKHGHAIHFGKPRLLLLLRIEYLDGTTRELISDSSWTITDNGPIRANNEFDGEEYDARMEMPGWSKAGFDDSIWQPAQPVKPPGGKLDSSTTRVTENGKPANQAEGVRFLRMERGTAVYEVGSGNYVFSSANTKRTADRRIE